MCPLIGWKENALLVTRADEATVMGLSFFFMRSQKTVDHSSIQHISDMFVSSVVQLILSQTWITAGWLTLLSAPLKSNSCIKLQNRTVAHLSPFLLILFRQFLLSLFDSRFDFKIITVFMGPSTPLTL